MRVTCPCCGQRFDLPHRAVLAEAARLNGHAATMERPAPAGPDANGNVLAPGDAAARRARREAIARRLGKPNGGKL
jgi:hypothetical protein